jgi:hypothetical protein
MILRDSDPAIRALRQIYYYIVIHLLNVLDLVIPEA